MRSLADRLACGEESAFTELYDACADRLHAFATARLRSRETASDIVQSTFMRVVKSRRRFRKVTNPVAYVFQIARNEVVRAAAKQRGQQVLSIKDPAEVVDFRGEMSVEDAEAAAIALGRLESADRELIELKLYARLTFREIAEATGEPQGTVATRYRRALESLRGWLEKQYQ